MVFIYKFLYSYDHIPGGFTKVVQIPCQEMDHAEEGLSSSTAIVESSPLLESMENIFIPKSFTSIHGSIGDMSFWGLKHVPCVTVFWEQQDGAEILWAILEIQGMARGHHPVDHPVVLW